MSEARLLPKRKQKKNVLCGILIAVLKGSVEGMIQVLLFNDVNITSCRVLGLFVLDYLFQVT